MSRRYPTNIHDELGHAEEILGEDPDKRYAPSDVQPIIVRSTYGYFGSRDRRRFGGFDAQRKRESRSRLSDEDEGQVLLTPREYYQQFGHHPESHYDEGPTPPSFTVEELAAQDGLFATIKGRRLEAAQAIAEELASRGVLDQPI